VNAHHTPRGVSSHGHTVRRCAQLATIIAFVASGAASSSAQRIPDINAPKRAAQKAADATNERLSAQTGQELPARRGAEATGTSAKGASTLAPGAMAPVTREVFTYEPDSRRDPFFSLILTEDLRPLLSDLKLVGILYEASGRRSVAIMRDILTNAQYRVNAGMTLGRMRVAQIKPRAVIFTIDEFGLSRQDSLVLVDSSKVRIR
jgi:hypothetical protein